MELVSHNQFKQIEQILIFLDVKVNFSSTDSEAYNINNGLTSTVTFGSNSELTLANGGTAKFIGANNRKWIFNGIIKGGGTIVIGGNAKADFGTTSNHANLWRKY